MKTKPLIETQPARLWMCEMPRCENHAPYEAFGKKFCKDCLRAIRCGR